MSTDFLIAVEGNRTAALKKKIIHYYIANGDATIADLCKEMDLSIPTVTKLVGELLEEGYILDFGKQETSGGRKPNIYGLNPESGYFIGVDVRRDSINIAAVDFKGKFISVEDEVPFTLENTPAALENLCVIIDEFIGSLKVSRDKILSVGINITKYKLMAFTISAAIAGAGGVLYAHNLSTLTALPANFGYNMSIMILVYVVLGGIGNIRGSMIAARAAWPSCNEGSNRTPSITRPRLFTGRPTPA